MKPYPHILEIPQDEPGWLMALVSLARYLRSPEGCPWDRQQTSRNFAAFTQEESVELIEALDSGSNEHAAEEWGDTFFTLLAAAAAAETEGRFTILGALQGAHEKMIRRHDHIFGEHRAETPEEAAMAWNQIKAREKEARGNNPPE